MLGRLQSNTSSNGNKRQYICSVIEIDHDPNGEEFVTPVSQLSGLGELSASVVAETDRRLEAIQRAQVSSLVGADKTKEPQEKIPKKLSPTLATRPKKYALEMWVEIEISPGMYSTPEDDSYSIDLAIDIINCTYPGCTGMYLDVAGHMLAFYGKKTNPQAGLLHDQGVIASKAIADIPSWMVYPAKWRVQCVSVSEARMQEAREGKLEASSLGSPEQALLYAVEPYPLCHC